MYPTQSRRKILGHLEIIAANAPRTSLRGSRNYALSHPEGERDMRCASSTWCRKEPKCEILGCSLHPHCSYCLTGVFVAHRLTDDSQYFVTLSESTSRPLCGIGTESCSVGWPRGSRAPRILRILGVIAVFAGWRPCFWSNVAGCPGGWSAQGLSFITLWPGFPGSGEASSPMTSLVSRFGARRADDHRAPVISERRVLRAMRFRFAAAKGC